LLYVTCETNPSYNNTLGVMGGLHAVYKISAGLAFLMAAMVGVLVSALALHHIAPPDPNVQNQL
jgi:hypothetical protein